MLPILLILSNNNVLSMKHGIAHTCSAAPDPDVCTCQQYSAFLRVQPLQTAIEVS